MAIETEQEKIKKAFEGSGQWFRSILDTMINGFQVIGSDWRYLYVNDALVKQGKVPREKLLGKTMMETYPGLEKTDIFKSLKESMEKRIVIRKETEFTFPDGSKSWFNTVIQPALSGISITSEDITERKQIEKELEHMASFPISNPNPITETDMEGKVFFMNPVAQQLFPDLEKMGFSHPWLMGLKFLVPDFYTGGVLVRNREISVSGKWYQQSIQFLPKEQRLRIQSVDITILKQIQERLIELDKLKDDFLAVTTHELKTPLIPIKSQSQLLLEGDYGELNSKQKEAIEMILRNEEALNLLSTEVLEIAKIKSKKLVLSLKKVQLVELILDAVKDTKNQFKQKQIAISLRPTPKNMPELILDDVRIRRVISNLLDNAIKFTPEKGEVVVEVRNEGKEIVVSVKDSGIGIAKENIEKLFTPFFQIDSSVSRKYRGTGLGLVVSKGVIEAHKGKIWAESEGEGKGSTFTFTLPINS